MENQVKPTSQSLMYGIVYGLLSASILYLFYKMDIEITGLSTLIHLIIATVCVLLPINLFKKTNQNELSIAKALKIGLVVGLIGGLIYATYTYIHFDAIDTSSLLDISEKMEEARAEMKQQNPEMTEEQIEQAIGITKLMVSVPAVAIYKFIGALLETFFVALIIGLIKKNN